MSVAERREREREQRRSRILDAAQRVFYAKGVDATKMKDVAREAQLGKGTLYLYFRTKEELTLAVAVRHQQKLIAKLAKLEEGDTDGAALVRSLLLAYARHISEPREHLRMAMTRWATGEPLDVGSRGGDQMRENVRQIFNTLCRAIERGKEDGTVRSGLDTTRCAMSLVAATNGALLMELQLACIHHEKVFEERAPTLEESIDLYMHAFATGEDVAREPVAAVVGGE
jgi:AcrR family transcriptional regulator